MWSMCNMILLTAECIFNVGWLFFLISITVCNLALFFLKHKDLILLRLLCTSLARQKISFPLS